MGNAVAATPGDGIVAGACPLCRAELTQSPRAFVKDGHVIVRCRTCGLLQRAERPDDAELELLYGQEYFSPGPQGDVAGYLDYLGDAEIHRANARKRLQLLERHVPPGSMLDVGCAAGLFVHEARARGWDARGVDLSPEMTAWGRSELGLPIETGSFTDLTGPQELDLVTMWDYIEHSNDPVGDVRKAHELLRPGGWLALSTGDAGSLVARLSGARWHLLTPRHHLFYFDRRTLRMLLADAGFVLAERRTRANSYSLRYLAHKLRSTVDAAPLRRLDLWLERSRLGGLSIPIDLGDIVTVIARRPE